MLDHLQVRDQAHIRNHILKAEVEIILLLRQEHRQEAILLRQEHRQDQVVATVEVAVAQEVLVL